MAGYDFAALTQDVSASEPCGPDLDLAGDPDFLNFVARAEGLLPASFFTRDGEGNPIPFDRASVDFAAEFRTLGKILDETRDLRLLTLYGRLLALNRDLEGFAGCMGAIVALVRGRWEDVHPKADNGDYTFRAAVLQALDDMPTVILPLQHMPIANSRRLGAIAYRNVMVARGEAQPRAGETPLDQTAIERILTEEDFDVLCANRDRWRTIQSAVNDIRAVSIDKAGFDQAVSFDRLPDLVAKVLGVLDPIIVARDPSAVAEPMPAAADSGPDTVGPAGAGPARTGPAGKVASVRDAARALAAVGRYFGRSEPSNPAALLVRQAESLMGKSFVDVIRLLIPTRAEEAKIPIGTDGVFDLTFQQLATSNDEIVSALDGQADADVASETAPEPIEATSRQEAAALLEQVSAFYRRAEPSSPIPLLTERARGLIERDFLAILKDVLPQLGVKES